MDPIDPNVITEDFVSQTARVLRQRKMAEMLRKQQQATGSPEGSMVSGRYVRAPVMQHLANALGGMNATGMERMADAEEQSYNQRVGQAGQQWRSQLPQALAAVPERAGPVDPSNPTELAPKPALPLTMGRISEHTLRGMAIPGNKEAAELYNRNATADLNREDVQAAKAEAAELKRVSDRDRDIQRAQDKMDQLKLMYGYKLTPEQQLAIKAQEDKTKRYIADRMKEGKLEAAEIAAKSKGVNVKPVPVNLKKSLDDDEDIAESIMRAYTTYKPEYGGLRGGWDAIRGLLPFADPQQEEATNWWANYEKGGLKERHDTFGATLTGNEATAWNNATIRKGQSPATIMQNLKTRSEIAARHFNKSRARAVGLGYPQVGEAYDEMPETAEMPTPMVPPNIQLSPPQQQRVPNMPQQRQPAPPMPVAPPVAPGSPKPIPGLAGQLGVTRG